MDDLTAQIDQLQIEQCWKSSDIPHGSKMTANDEELVFTSAGKPKVVLPCKKIQPHRTSGAICLPGDLLVKTATSGWRAILQKPAHQLDNTDGTSVWQMCSDLDYHLPRHGHDSLFNGQYYAVHTEKILLEYYYAHAETLAVTSGRKYNAEERKKVILYVDKLLCLDCLLFMAFFETKTNTTIEVYVDGKEQIDPQRHAITPAVDLLIDVEEIELEHEETLKQCAESQLNDPWRTDSWEEWLKGFIQMKRERREGRARSRLRGITVKFVDEDE